MKLHLKICANNIHLIQKILYQLSQERLEDNQCGTMHEGEYDCYFVNSDNLFSEDQSLMTMQPDYTLKENERQVQ